MTKKTDSKQRATRSARAADTTKTVTQKAGTKKPAAREKIKLVSGGITPDRRSQMIAQAAWYLAEHRGFSPEGQEQDWLVAESEVDAMLNKSSS